MAAQRSSWTTAWVCWISRMLWQMNFLHLTDSNHRFTPRRLWRVWQALLAFNSSLRCSIAIIEQWFQHFLSCHKAQYQESCKKSKRNAYGSASCAASAGRLSWCHFVHCWLSKEDYSSTRSDTNRYCLISSCQRTASGIPQFVHHYEISMMVLFIATTCTEVQALRPSGNFADCDTKVVVPVRYSRPVNPSTQCSIQTNKYQDE